MGNLVITLLIVNTIEVGDFLQKKSRKIIIGLTVHTTNELLIQILAKIKKISLLANKNI